MDENSKDLRDVVSKMAHDLRTPLAVVHTTTNMLLNPKYKFSEQQVREQHERIRRNVEVMDRLIGQLSELAKPASGDSAADSDAAMRDGG
jgi:K+-sensing histidine kinase KdpD